MCQACVCIVLLAAAPQAVLAAPLALAQTPFGTASHSTSAASSVARTGTALYRSGYSADGWTGYLRCDSLAQDTAAATPHPAWGLQSARAMTTADKLDALTDVSARLILTTRDDESTGVEFQWENLSTAQKNGLRRSAETDATAIQRVHFLRGERSLEGGNKPFRLRQSRQGDIVHSAPWWLGAPSAMHAFDGYRQFAAQHAARLPMVYVGGNDGMLHGFSGVDGAEKIAYIPKGVMGQLKDLSTPGYAHRYYVDGSPFSGDVNGGSSAAPDWRSLLVGSLGAGGKGYFVLDITRPGSSGPTAVANHFSASNAARLVVMDKTSSANDASGDTADLGHIFAAPVTEDQQPQQSTQIARLNNGRWAVVMGNGYNSRNERPVLLIQYLDGAKELHTLVAAAEGSNAVGNGLSAPRLVDINGDGTPDAAYAGDLRGNLWKFDMTAADPARWHTAFGNRPLYSAVYTSGNASSVQPITSAPVVRSNNSGARGLMVAFGTGRKLTEDDLRDRSVQTIYAVLDSTLYQSVDHKLQVDTSAGMPQPVGTGWGSLVQQTVSSAAIAGPTRRFWTVSQNPVNYTGTSPHKGWYLHLPVAGERLLDNMSFYDGSKLLELLTEVPGAPAQRFRTFLHLMDGSKPSVQIVDANGDGLYDAQDGGASRMTASPQESRVRSRSQEIRTGADGSVDKLRKLPEQALRPSWRQLR